MPRCTCEFRFYEELNDYLPPEQRKRTIAREITGTPSVKDAIESLGVPHTEIDLILVDGRSVRFDRRLRGGERIAVYPEFERFDISPLHRLRPKPLREPRFVADVHLGTLARFLRLLGFDTRYGNGLDDAELAAITSREKRILLTRDVGLLKRKAVVRGQWLRSRDPEQQVTEIVEALHLKRLLRPFTRCMTCNGDWLRLLGTSGRSRAAAGVSSLSIFQAVPGVPARLLAGDAFPSPAAPRHSPALTA